jgi:site-specific DNA-methyltransferase (adenine-specific)
MQIRNGEFWLGDCLELMKDIPDGSVDMVLCDLPYGTTACKWDTIIPFEPLWEQYWRVAKPNAAIVLTASQPFTAALVMSNVAMFKYCWVWDKKKPSNYPLAKQQPMKYHEDICVFSSGKCVYFPEMVPVVGRKSKKGVNKNPEVFQGGLDRPDYLEKVYTDKYPSSILKASNADQRNRLHPTQKPVALFEYLIKTYTNEGETVLDNCAGSGTTAIAAENTNRKWICIEQLPKYYYPAIMRVAGI